LFRVLIAALSALGVIAGFDYFFPAHPLHPAQSHVQAGIKEEHRQNEGDPIIKARCARSVMSAPASA